MRPPSYQVIYTSCPCESFTPAALSDVMDVSRRNNLRHDITGILLHTEDQILQVVEGPQEAVLQLMERIRADTRHEDLRIILAHTVARRDFGEWNMALREMPREALGACPALSEFFEPGFDIQALRYGSPATFLLRAFHELNVKAT